VTSHYKDLQAAYAAFNQPTSNPGWDANIGSFLDDSVSLFDYDKDPALRRTDGKANVIAALKAIRDDLDGTSTLLEVHPPPYNPAHLEPGAAAVDRMKVRGTRPDIDAARKASRTNEHLCSDLFKFDEATGLVTEIHYCVTEAHSH